MRRPTARRRPARCASPTRAGPCLAMPSKATEAGAGARPVHGQPAEALPWHAKCNATRTRPPGVRASWPPAPPGCQRGLCVLVPAVAAAAAPWAERPEPRARPLARRPGRASRSRLAHRASHLPRLYYPSVDTQKHGGPPGATSPFATPIRGNGPRQLKHLLADAVRARLRRISCTLPQAARARLGA